MLGLGRQQPEVCPGRGLAQLGCGPGHAVLLEQRHEQLVVQVGRVHVLQCAGVANLPVADQVAVQAARPTYAAFQKGEAQPREAARHAVQKDGLADRLAGLGEMPDVVIDEVRHRAAHPDARRRGMEARGNADLQALGPDRIVVVGAVDPQRVVPDGIAAGRGRFARHHGHRAAEQTRQHGDLEAAALDEFQFFDRLVRGEHRHDRGRGQPVFQARKLVRGVRVECPTRRAPDFIVAQKRREQCPAGRIDHPEVDAQFVQAFVQEFRQHGGRTVARVAGRHAPPGGLQHASVAALVGRCRGPAGVAELVGDLGIACDHRGAGDLVQIVQGQGFEFYPVAVGVDDRMVEAGTNRFGGMVG